MTLHPALDGAVRGRPDIEGDTQRLLDVVANGGIAITPANLGYGLVAATPEANHRIIDVKQRGAHKRQGLVMDMIQSAIHVLDQSKSEWALERIRFGRSRRLATGGDFLRGLTQCGGIEEIVTIINEREEFLN